MGEIAMKKTVYGCVAACAAALIVWSGSCPAVAQAPAAGIEPEASAIVKALSESGARIKHMRIKVYDTMDEMTESGEMIQYAHVRTAVVRRPDRLWLESRGDQANTTLWYDGTMFSLLDRDRNAYVTIQARATIDATIDMVYDSYDISTPLADVLSGNIYDVLMKGVVTCRYIGEGLVGEKLCHHIAATEKEIDWQAWIDKGDKPRLRKLVITYKQLAGAPRYSAVLVEEEELAASAPETFVFQAPKGAEKIEAVPRERDDKPRL
jgi:hypothetical protein